MCMSLFFSNFAADFLVVHFSISTWDLFQLVDTVFALFLCQNLQKMIHQRLLLLILIHMLVKTNC